MSPRDFLSRIKNLRFAAKAGIVLGGYAASFLIAFGIAWISSRFFQVADSASSGMQAFGDAVLFLVVFCACACVPTVFAVAFWILSRADFADLKAKSQEGREDEDAQR